MVTQIRDIDLRKHTQIQVFVVSFVHFDSSFDDLLIRVHWQTRDAFARERHLATETNGRLGRECGVEAISQPVRNAISRIESGCLVQKTHELIPTLLANKFVFE